MDVNSSQLPNEILRSGTIESLISQNEDLMTRLKVTLRRMSLLEEENIRVTKESKETQNQFSSLTDQLLILKEKDEIWRKRTREAEENFEYLQTQHRLQEVEFSELRNSVIEQKKILLNKFNTFESELFRLRRFHARIRQYVDPMVKDLRMKLYNQSIDSEQLKNKIENLDIQLQNQILHNQSLINENRDQRNYFEEEKYNLINATEKERDDLSLEIKRLINLNQELEKRSDKLNKSLERQDYLENRVICLERELELKISKHNELLDQQESSLNQWRSQAQRFEIQNQTLTQKLKEVEEQASNYKNANSKLEEQLQGLRLLWEENSIEVERLRVSNSSLDKLNSELCIKLNEARNQNLNSQK